MSLKTSLQMGRYRLGEFAFLPVQCVNASNVTVDPTAAPQVSIYAADGTEAVADQKVPPVSGRTTGLFAWSQFLGSGFSVGIYSAYFSYAISGTNFSSLAMFEVIGGGNVAGPYVALEHYSRPHADFIIGHREDGTTDLKRGAYV